MPEVLLELKSKFVCFVIISFFQMAREKSKIGFVNS